MTKPDVWIVTVNWNGKAFLKGLLSSLQNLNHQEVKLTVLVVDNASDDGSSEYLKGNFPGVRLLQLSENTGFGKGNNSGIKTALGAGADYVWLLNNDTTVDKNALTLVSAFADPLVGAASSKIYFAEGAEYHAPRYRKEDLGKVVWYAGGLIDWANVYASHRGVDEVDRGQYDQSTKTAFATGCSVMISRKALQKAGLFDERYFLYLEDVDLSVRINHAGFKIVYFPGSVVWHHNAATSGGPGSAVHEYYQTRNRFLFGMKYAPLRTKLALIREALRFLRKGNTVQKQAVGDAIRGHYGKKSVN